MSQQLYLFYSIRPEDLATIMMFQDDEDTSFDLLGDDDDKLLTDEEILALLLEDISTKNEPTHRKYDSFDIDAFTDEEFRSFFRFSREHISPLMQVLRLRKNYKASNGIRWSGEEGLCMVLRRLCYPNRLSDLIPIFGRHHTEMSTIINEMCTEIFALHQHRISSIFQPWLNFQQSAEAVHNKGACLDNCWGFLDGTQMRVCRPDEGQESVYNGHKRQHSLKFQSLMLPFGLISHFWGPFEGRCHDSAMFYFSGLGDQISQVTIDGKEYCVYGDSAYAA